MSNRVIRLIAVLALVAAAFQPAARIPAASEVARRAAKRNLFFTDYGADLVYVVQAKFTSKKVKGAKHKKSLGQKISAPYAAAIDPVKGSHVYVTNEGSNSVAIIDAKKRKVLGTVPVGKKPHGIDVTPDGKYAFVVNSGDNTVSIIDLDAALARVGEARIAEAVIGTVSVAKGAESVTINDRPKAEERPTEVYVTSLGADVVSKINAASAIAAALDGATPRVAQVIQGGCEMNGGIETTHFGSVFSSTMWTCDDGTLTSRQTLPSRDAGWRGSEDEDEEEFEEEEEELDEEEEGWVDPDTRTGPSNQNRFRFLFPFQVPYPTATSVTAIRSTLPFVDKTFGCTEAAWIYTATPNAARADGDETFIWDFFNPEVSLGKGRVIDQVMGTTGTGVYVHPACGEKCDTAKIAKGRKDVTIKNAVNIMGGAVFPVLPPGVACG